MDPSSAGRLGSHHTTLALEHAGGQSGSGLTSCPGPWLANAALPGPVSGCPAPVKDDVLLSRGNLY